MSGQLIGAALPVFKFSIDSFGDNQKQESDGGIVYEFFVSIPDISSVELSILICEFHLKCGYAVYESHSRSVVTYEGEIKFPHGLSDGKNLARMLLPASLVKSIMMKLSNLIVIDFYYDGLFCFNEKADTAIYTVIEPTNRRIYSENQSLSKQIAADMAFVYETILYTKIHTVTHSRFKNISEKHDI